MLIIIIKKLNKKFGLNKKMFYLCKNIYYVLYLHFDCSNCCVNACCLS